MSLRVVFLGSDPIALPLLEWLASEGRDVAEVVAVYTQPDRPAGRGQKVVANAIKQWAEARGLPVLQPERPTPDTPREMAAFQPDVALVMAYGHILRDELIAVPRLGTLNLHTSALPKYRGASPIQSAIAAGERTTAVTLMRIVRALDAGPVADQEVVPIGPLDTAADLESRLAAATVPLLARSLPALAQGRLQFVEQEHGAATYCRRLAKADGQLDFSAPAAALAARINGLYPWPACCVTLGGQTVKIGLADAASRSAEGLAAPAGTVLEPDAEGLLVACGAGVVRLRRLQRPGGRMLPAAEFLRGFAVAPGTRVPSQAMAPLVADRPFR